MTLDDIIASFFLILFFIGLPILLVILIWKWGIKAKKSEKSLNPKVLILSLLIIVVMILIIGLYKASIPDRACNQDWKNCSTNLQLLNNYNDLPKVVNACKAAAIEKAKYGNPVFSDPPFQIFLDDQKGGRKYISDGILTLIEKRAQFQNGFGAMQNVAVTCNYDLNTQKVDEVFIDDFNY